MAPSQQCNGTTGEKKDLTVSCDETKHETTSPEQDHSIPSARSNGWAECRDKKVSASSRRGRMSLDIPFYRTWTKNALLVEVPEQLACPRFNCNTNHRTSCSPGMENGRAGRSLSLSFRMESTTDGWRIPRLAEFARIKTNSSGLITPKAGWSIRLSQHQKF